VSRGKDNPNFNAGNGDSDEACINVKATASLGQIAFSSFAGDLDIQGGEASLFPHVYLVGTSSVISLATAITKQSVDSAEKPGDNTSGQPALSADGLHLAFASFATSLAEPGDVDNNGEPDVFVRHLEFFTGGVTQRVSRDCGGGQGNAISFNPDVFLSGRAVVYESFASNLISPNQDMLGQSEGNTYQDVFESRIELRFIRGDVDPNGIIQVTDAVQIFSWLFQGGLRPECVDAADVDDNGIVDLTHGVRILNFISIGGPPPAPPFPACGFDPTPDCLSCKRRQPQCADDHAH
jgi:hypothetical protein